jgi:drug/metabolite transporter (DMT)-like permease
VLIVAMSYFIFGETIGWRQGTGLLLTLIGVAVIVSEGQLSRLLELTFNIGDAWILAAVLSWAIYSSVLRKRPALHPLSFLAATFIIGVTALLPFYLWEHTSGKVMQVNQVTLLAVAYVVIFPSTLSYFFFNRGIELAGANRGGIVMNLMPVCGTLLAILLLDERFLGFHVVGIVLILGGIFLATIHRR